MEYNDQLPNEVVARKIILVRGLKVMLDSDLAELYQVPVKRLNEQVKRNIERFPTDFAFQLTKSEAENLRSQFATSSSGYGGRRYTPYVFTEHGVAMLTAVLRSDRAVHMSIFIVRAFVKLREMLATHADLAHKMEDLERGQKENREQIAAVYSVVKQLIAEPPKQKRKIGFAS